MLIMENSYNAKSAAAILNEFDKDEEKKGDFELVEKISDTKNDDYEIDSSAELKYAIENYIEDETESLLPFPLPDDSNSQVNEMTISTCGTEDSGRNSCENRFKNFAHSHFMLDRYISQIKPYMENNLINISRRSDSIEIPPSLYTMIDLNEFDADSIDSSTGITFEIREPTANVEPIVQNNALSARALLNRAQLLRSDFTLLCLHIVLFICFVSFVFCLTMLLIQK